MEIKLCAILALWFVLVYRTVPTRIGKVLLNIPFIALTAMTYIIYLGEMK